MTISLEFPLTGSLDSSSWSYYPESRYITEKRILQAKSYDGFAVADPRRDIAKLAVIERHHKTGNVGLGFVQGLGIEKGAIVSSVAHDSHNLVVAGMSDSDMLVAQIYLLNWRRVSL